MEIITAGNSGFCMGVKLAMEKAMDAASAHGHIYSLGPLIHNPQEIARISGQVISVDRLEDIKERPAVVMIRSHGVSPEALARAAAMGLEILDCTCPFVAKAQRKAAEFIDAGYELYILGDAEHPEVIGLKGYSRGKAHIISSPSEAEQAPPAAKIALLSQTTQKVEDFRAAAQILESKCGEFRAENTVCEHTRIHQQATRELAHAVDAMIVIGGFNSANTKKLAQISKEADIAVFHIETLADLDLDIVRSYGRVGVTAGASTPEHIIEEVVTRMAELDKLENVVEENTENSCECGCEETNCEPQALDETAEPCREEAEEEQPIDAFTEAYGTMKEIRRGSRVKGTVVQVKDDELLVDIGGKSEGVLSASELNTDEAKDIPGHFNVGDEIEVLVLRKENQEGYPVLSKRRVDQDIAWDRLAQLKQDKEIVSGTVTDVVKGGLLVDVGLRGFVPASLVALGYVEDLSTYMGKTLDMKIIECDKHSNKLVLSAKAVLRKASAALKEKTWAEIAEGQTRHGVVRRLTNFGAFVDVGGVDGLLHVSEMAWYRVNHPSDLLKEGDEIDVYVLGVDAENEKISLGLKQLTPNPWTLAADKYPADSVIEAKVMRTTNFGAFLEVEPGVEGLVHISQLANHRVEKTEDVVKPGDIVNVKVLSVDPEAKRMSLSIKATLPPDEDLPIEKEIADEAPADEAPVEEAPVEEAPAAEAAAEDAVAAEEPAAEEEAPAEDAAGAEAPAEEE